jgi:hypothetical protein
MSDWIVYTCKYCGGVSGAHDIDCEVGLLGTENDGLRREITALRADLDRKIAENERLQSAFKKIGGLMGLKTYEQRLMAYNKIKHSLPHLAQEYVRLRADLDRVTRERDKMKEAGKRLHGYLHRCGMIMGIGEDHPEDIGGHVLALREERDALKEAAEEAIKWMNQHGERHHTPCGCTYCRIKAALAAVKLEKKFIEVGHCDSCGCAIDKDGHGHHSAVDCENMREEEKPEICRRCGQEKHKHLNGEICRTEGSGGPQYFASASKSIEQKEV